MIFFPPFYTPWSVNILKYVKIYPKGYKQEFVFYIDC